jgi:uncharacterized membrane protein YraQ (UPF0718 family)
MHGGNMIEPILSRLKDALLWLIPVAIFIGLFAFVFNVNFDFQLPNFFKIFASVSRVLVPAESIFLAIIVESFPFVILGALVSSFIQEFVSQERLVRWIPRNRIAAVLLGGVLGLVVPTCDCGTIPIAKSLLRKGVPQCATVAFTLAAPVINPVTMAATYVAFGFHLHIVVLRVLCTYAIACIVGLLVSGRSQNLERQLREATLEVAVATDLEHHQRERNLTVHWGRFKHIVEHTVSEFFGIAGFLVCSAAVASIYQVYHTQHAHFGQMHSGLLAVAAMMGLGIIFSLCSEADAFVARSFAVSYSQGSVLSFMLIGQMADLRNLFLLPNTFGFKRGVTIIALSVVLCFVIGLLV